MFQEDNILSSTIKLSELEAHIGIEFENKNHLKKAFIHSSLKGDYPNVRDNQTLEFLGDAVLGLIISEYAYEKYESKMYFVFELSNSMSDEGRFSTFRDEFVIGDCICKIAKKLKLGKYLIMSNGEKQNKDGEPKRLTDCLEALIGAIYEDQGYSKAREFTLGIYGKYIDRFFLNKYKEELSILEKTLESKPKNSDLLTAQGRILHELKRYKEALKPLNKAIELNPEDEDAWAFKVYCLYEIEKYDEALITANRLIEINPEFEFIWVDKGNILFELNKFDEAVEAYKKSIEFEPDDYETYYEIAKIYSMKKIKEETLYYLKKAIDSEIYEDKIIPYPIEKVFIESEVKNDNEFKWLLEDKEFMGIFRA